MKRISLLIFMCLSILCNAQEDALRSDISKIDSLISVFKLDEASAQTDSLINVLGSFSKRRAFKKEFLELQYRKALILDERQVPPSEALKILLEIADEVKEAEFNSLLVRVYLLISLCHEKSDDFKLTKKYLDLALQTIKHNKLDEMYSTYYLRRSSYDRYVNKSDSSFHHARQAELYAKKYDNKKVLLDAYLLIDIYYSKKGDFKNALHYSFLRLENTPYDSLNIGRLVQLNNIAKRYFQMGNLDEALAYSDSAYLGYKVLPTSYKLFLPSVRYQIFEKMGNLDSAYFYLKKYYFDDNQLRLEEDEIKVKQIEELYQNVKNSATIKNQKEQVMWTSVLLAVIAISAILLTLQNRKIKNRNKTINNQLEELSKALDQKQMLLSELQHRVKNNLQHVISILEIQKESVDFNSIEELIRGNQNRIHSMALLHKKLNVSDNVNDIDLKKYVTELADLVKHSYDNHQRKISLQISCPVEHIEIDKALPVGLIITELVSNSMKHAFNTQSIGIINVNISTDEKGRFSFNYADNGSGYDFNKSNSKGLGQEIIKGLINQLDGEVVTNSTNGFEITIYFN
ncbi:MAG: histidine kinase dimerization/phosphoacceptor domain -containing protein [Flavobacteriales bacterium]